MKWITFAVGIWTAIGGVANSPGAEGCMVGGCIGLKAPWGEEPSAYSSWGDERAAGWTVMQVLCLTASVKPDCWLACSSCFWRGIPAPGMYPGEDEQSFNWWASNTLQDHIEKLRRKLKVSYQAARWSGCALGILAAGAAGTAWPETLTHLKIKAT